MSLSPHDIAGAPAGNASADECRVAAIVSDLEDALEESGVMTRRPEVQAAMHALAEVAARNVRRFRVFLERVEAGGETPMDCGELPTLFDNEDKAEEAGQAWIRTQQAADTSGSGLFLYTVASA